MLSIRKVSFFVGLPIAAIALALFVMSLGNGAPKAQAALDPQVNFNISATGCNSSGTPTAKCSVPVGGAFSVAFNISALPNTGTTDNYDAYDMKVTYAGSVTGPTAPAGVHQTGAGNWPDCVFNASAFPPSTVSAGCGIGISATSSTYLGALLHMDFTCSATPGAGTITLVAGDGNTDAVDSTITSHSEAVDETLTVNCQVAPTNTPVPPTGTPPPQPRVQKVCSTPLPSTPPKDEVGSTTPVGTSLCNHFLEREGAKIPPAPGTGPCDSRNQVNLAEGINIPITTLDPKDANALQQLAAFEFEVRFDNKLVCVEISEGPAWTAAGALCSSLVNEGLVRFGCVTIGKGADLNDSVIGCGDADPLTLCLPLAMVQVHPLEEVFSILRPNQDNGIAVQIMNQNCELADEQGHVIPIFSCEDADITFRFLEGDVDGPDCDVDITDAQNVAFRWGAQIGSLLFNSFMDLEPSGQVKGDGDIDIKDLQFVFGRMPSTCANPWPPQPPVNPKA